MRPRIRCFDRDVLTEAFGVLSPEAKKFELHAHLVADQLESFAQSGYDEFSVPESEEASPGLRLLRCAGLSKIVFRDRRGCRDNGRGPRVVAVRKILNAVKSEIGKAQVCLCEVGLEKDGNLDRQDALTGLHEDQWILCTRCSSKI